MSETNDQELERHEIVLIQKMLGLQPFIVIEMDGERGPNFDTDDNDFTLKFDLTFGGGIGIEEVPGVLATLLEEQFGWTCQAPAPEAKGDEGNG